MNAQHASESERQEQSQFWSRYFGVYDSLNTSRPYRTMLDRHVDLLDIQPADRILDAGTGTGNVAARMVATGGQVVGIDFCERGLQMCRDKVPDATFSFADLTQPLPFADDTFDKLTCCNTIYTLRPGDQATAVGELCRVLRAGGQAVFVVFDDDFSAVGVVTGTLAAERQARGWGAAIRLFFKNTADTVKCWPFLMRLNRNRRDGSFTYYTEGTLRELLAAGGFDVELIEPTLAGQCLLAHVTKPNHPGGSS